MVVFVALGQHEAFQMTEVHMSQGVLTLGILRDMAGCRLRRHVMVHGLLALKEQDLFSGIYLILVVAQLNVKGYDLCLDHRGRVEARRSLRL